MSKNGITEKQVEAAAKLLKEAQPKERILPRAEALALLREEIRAAKARGLNAMEITALLGKAGIEANEAAVKRAIAEPRKKPSTTTP